MKTVFEKDKGVTGFPKRRLFLVDSNTKKRNTLLQLYVTDNTWRNFDCVTF
jgi:hypothetical protein